MKSLQLGAVILFSMYTHVYGRMETVHCDVSYISNITCDVHVVEDPQKPISIIIFDEIPKTSVFRLTITGKLESIPDLSDATIKFMKLIILAIWDVRLKNVKGDQGDSDLHLDDNEISDFDADSFKNLHDVKENNNKLKVKDTFKGLNDLLFLALYDNQIEVLPNGLFDDNQKLSSVFLFNNKLKEIHVDTFKELAALTGLQLNNNQLEILPATIFRSNKMLHKIFLNNNKLKVIDSDTFKGLNDLIFLTLNDNQIEVLPKGLFDDNTKLLSVDLQDNKLMKIEIELHKLQKLYFIYLSGNICIDQDCKFEACSAAFEFIETIQQKCSN